MTLQKQMIKNITGTSDFHLNDPLVTITFKLDQAHHPKPYELKIGMSNPITNSSYITYEGSDKIFQIDVVSNKIINFQDELIYDDRALAFNPSGLTGLSYSFPNSMPQKLTLNREDQAWQKENGETVKIEIINGALKNIKLLRNIKVIQYSDQDTQTYEAVTQQLGQPTLKLEFHYKDKLLTYSGHRVNGKVIGLSNAEYLILKEENREDLTVLDKVQVDQLYKILTDLSN